MSASTVYETSFDILVQNIRTPSRSRSNSLPSNGGAPGTTSSRQSQNSSPRDSGICIDDASSTFSSPGQHSMSPKATSLRRSNTSGQDAYRSPRGGGSDWTARSRSGSVTSSSSSDKLSHTGMLRHTLGRKTTIREEQNRQFAVAKSIRAPNRPGCILSSNPEMIKNIKGATPSGLPVWWCRFDNMVIFDGMLKDGETGEWIPITRSSKGLPISNSKGHEESALLELQCNHCKNMLDLHNWRYSTKVCQRSVCAGCKVRCRQEYFRMMKEGHSFNHFEKVSEDPVTQKDILERISTPDLTQRILAPPLSQRTDPSEAAYFVPLSSLHSFPDTDDRDNPHQCEPVATEPVVIESIVPEVTELEILQPIAHQPEPVDRVAMLSDQVRLSSSSFLEYPQPLAVEPIFQDTLSEHSPDVNESFQQIASQENLHEYPDKLPEATLIAHSRDDIGLAITLDSPEHVLPDLQLFVPFDVTHSPRLVTEFVLRDLPRKVHLESPHSEQPESPQSEYPQTPKFEQTEPQQIIEDLLSPGLKNDMYEDEPFDISLIIRNLDTDEVSTIPV